MNKLILAGAAAAAMFAAASPASADVYAGIGVGQGSASVEGIQLNDAQSVDLTVGTAVNVRGIPLRVEGRVERGSANFFDVVDVNSLTYSADAFYDFNVDALGSARPYVGAGVQWTQAEANLGPFNLDATGAGWNVAAGVRIPVSERGTVDVGYRHGESELDVDFLGKADVDTDTARVALNWAL